MGSCPRQTFSGITQAQFDCLAKAAQNENVPISGNSGSASKDGITVVWTYDPGSQTLDIQCTGHPLLIPCGTINSRIKGFVDGCGGG